MTKQITGTVFFMLMLVFLTGCGRANSEVTGSTPTVISMNNVQTPAPIRSTAPPLKDPTATKQASDLQTPFANLADEPFLETVHDAKQKWIKQNIDSYKISFEFYESFGSGLTTRRDVVVQQGKVIEHSCGENLCPAFVLQKIHTINDLYRVAEGATIPGKEYLLTDCIKPIPFDETYGFPTRISVDCPGHADEENSVTVLSFEVLK